ncbi:putative C-mannosyltransferase DPY19L4 [Anomaloglossus baeobatrachus]|uniref:putative C-mannosyltransferase DPY19L4 n=1 Tax=Anomaloglossus baeobatrachus TaxID=238106 RepID=UPI003F4FA7F0
MASFLSGPINSDSWVEDANQAFCTKETPEGGIGITSLRTKFNDLYLSYKEYTKSWWEIKALENYLKNKIVPKGLRINIRPSPRTSSPKLLEAWQKESVESSLRLMTILLQEEKALLEQATVKLNTDIESILKCKSDPDFNKRESTLQTSIEKYQGYLKERKHLQFQRDLREFNTNQAYHFASQAQRETDVSSSDLEYSDTEKTGAEGWSNRRGQTGDIQGLSIEESSELVSSDIVQGGLNRNQIINLSSCSLSEKQYDVLKKGLSFVPTNDFNCFHWVKDLQLFGRKLKWRKFFLNNDRENCKRMGLTEEDLEGYQSLMGLLQEQSTTSENGLGPFTRLRGKSKKMPPQGDTLNIDIFLELVERDLKRIPRKGGSNSESNLSSEEWSVLEELEKNDNLVLKPSDKGGNLVIMDHEKYLGMCQRILGDRNIYAVLPSNPMNDFESALVAILEEAREGGLLSNSEFDFLKPVSPMLPTFYALPKVHKGLDVLKGRPIISGVDSYIQNSGIYIDEILRPFVISLPSYTRDTADLLGKIDGIVVGEEFDGTSALFEKFVEQLNVNDLGLHFTFEINANELPFLDVTILKERDGGLSTRTYRKPTATNNLLRWDSHHPTPLKMGARRRRRRRARASSQESQESTRSGEGNNTEVENGFDLQWLVKILVGFIIMITICMMYVVHLLIFHERKFWFSSRTDIDREITFQGDGAIYYSFYRDMLQAPTFEEGIIELVINNKTVPMRTLNIVRQLALYPEVFAGMLYQLVGRQDLSPANFYLGMVCGLQGIYIGSLFVTSWILSGTWLAGLLTIVWFLINGTDTTRIADSIPLRENWALPCFAGQVAGLTGFIRHNSNIKVERISYMIFCAASYLLIMFWEYSHYLIFLQALTLCLLDGLSLINKDKMEEIRNMYFAAVSFGFLTQFQNVKLLTSPLLSLMLASMVVKTLLDGVRSGTFQPKVMTMIYFCLMFTLSLAIHFFMGTRVYKTDDDQILKSVEVKLGLNMNKNFTVSWLLCQESFQPLSQDCLSRLTQSSLLPFYILVSIICLVSMCQGLFNNRGNQVRSNTSEDGRIGERPEVVYNVIQSLVLGVLAMTFEGLKYLWTPYVCVLAASGVFSPALWLTVFRWIRLRAVNPVVLALLLSSLVPALIGFSLWREYLPRIVEESIDLEERYESDVVEVMNWIQTLAPATAVFAGSPAMMGAIKLCTGRMVTSLPVYNDEELNKRNEDMYQLYSMRSAEDIYKILTTYKASYMVLEESICSEHFKLNCRVKDLLDIGNGHVMSEDEDIFAYSEYRRFCHEIKMNYSPYVNYFTRVYWNRSYCIYKINTIISFQS